MRIAFRIIFAALFTYNICYAQVDSVYSGRPEDPSKRENKIKPRDDAWKEKVTWGGNFQAWIGNPTFIFLSPTVGYIPFKNFNIGIGGIYNYTKFRSYYGNYSQSIFGGHSYLRYIIAQNYFVQAQFDKLRQPDLFSYDPKDRVWVDYLLVGGGIRQAIGERVALSTSIMYNLTPHPFSIYPGRIIFQFGIVGGF